MCEVCALYCCLFGVMVVQGKESYVMSKLFLIYVSFILSDCNKSNRKYLVFANNGNYDSILHIHEYLMLGHLPYFTVLSRWVSDNYFVDFLTDAPRKRVDSTSSLSSSNGDDWCVNPIPQRKMSAESLCLTDSSSPLLSRKKSTETHQRYSIISKMLYLNENAWKFVDFFRLYYCVFFVQITESHRRKQLKISLQYFWPN